MERILNKRNVMSLGLFALCFHVVTMHMSYFMDISVLMIVSYVFLGLTAAAAILFIAVNRIPVRLQPAQALLVLFMAWFIISCVSMGITYDNDWVNHNSFPMLNTAVSMFLAFPLGYVTIREEKNSFGKILLHALLAAWTVFIIYVLIRIFQGETIPTLNGGIIRMNMASKKYNCLEINCNRNITGSWEMLFFMTCCLMAFRCKPPAVRIIYGLSAAVHFTALSLSNSRVCILSSMAAFAAFAGIIVWIRAGKGPKGRKVLYAVLAALAAGAVFYFLSGLVIRLYNSGTGARVSNRSELAKVAADTTLNGRINIWKGTVEGVFSSFRMAVFGVTPMSVSDMIEQMVGKKWAHAHNQLLQIAAANGIPALCLFLGWFFIMLKDMYRLIRARKEQSAFLFIPVMILALMLANTMEALLVYGYELVGFVFFLLCGILHGRACEPVSEPLSLRRFRIGRRP